MRSIVTIAVFAFAVLASTTQAEAHCRPWHPLHCAKAVVEVVVDVGEEAVEVVVDVAEEVVDAGEVVVDGVAKVPIVGQILERPLDAALGTAEEVTDTTANVAGSVLNTTGDVVGATVDGDLGGAIGAAGDGALDVTEATVGGAVAVIKTVNEETVAPAIEAVGDVGEEINDHVIAPAIEAGGDLVIDPVVRAMTRCHARAEREPDPEKKQALVAECNNRKTGEILGIVGTAVGSIWGVAGMAAGSAIGSVVGSAIDGSPNFAVRVLVDVPDVTSPGPERPEQPEQPDADDGGAASAPSPDRRLASQMPRTARLLPNPWNLALDAFEPNMLNDGEEDALREHWREHWRAQRASEIAKLEAAVRDMNAAFIEAENTMRPMLELMTDLCVGDDCMRICETDPGGRACDKVRQRQ